MNAIQQLLTDHIDIWTAADTEKKSGRGRSSANAASVYGIRKLRELILELAVRGKLVPQDPKDELASTLLKSIQADKAKLIAEGKIKQDKPLLPIAEDEKPYVLPHGWEWVRLGNTGKIFNGNSINENEKLEKYTNLKEGLPFIATKDVGYGRDELDYKNGVLIPFESKTFKIAHAGVVLICSEGGSAGKKIGISNMDICFGNKLYANEVWTGLEPRFIFYVYQSPCFFESFSERMTGIIGGISINEFLNIPIPIPSEAEQKRIVAKVDELMALCDQLETQHNNAAEAHEKLVSHLLGTLTQSQSAADFSANWQRIAAHFDTLFTTETSIAFLKQTLLQLAVMGKLVPQDPNDVPASELLKRIQAEKAKLIAEGKIKKGKPLALITEDEKQFELPEKWEWVRFDVVANTRLGKMLDKVKNKGVNRPYLRNTNVQWSGFELNDLKEMRFENRELDEYRVISGDLVICEGGEPGRCAIWKGQVDEMFIQKALHRARPWEGVLPEFLQFCFRVDASNGYLSQFFTGATIKHFSGEKLSGYPVPLPPTSEQHRIVAKVDELMALCDQLKYRITAANQLQQKLADVLVEQVIL